MRVTIIGPGNLGRGIATRLLAGGHAVTLVGREREQAEALAREPEDTAQRAGEILTAHGGRFVNHYGRWTTRSIAQ